MLIKFILLLIAPTLFTTTTSHGKPLSKEAADNYLHEINKSLEILESDLRRSNYNRSCLEATKAAKIIKKNIQLLKGIEPYYNWADIRGVLLEIPKKYCSDSSIK